MAIKSSYRLRAAEARDAGVSAGFVHHAFDCGDIVHPVTRAQSAPVFYASAHGPNFAHARFNLPLLSNIGIDT